MTSSNAWLLLAFGPNRSHGGNEGYADNPASSYRYDSLVQNARSLAQGDLIVLRDHEEMLGFAVVEEIVSRPAMKRLRRCPICRTTKIGERSARTPRFRCKASHEFDEPITEEKECTEFEARYQGTFRPARGTLSIVELRASCPRYTSQLSIQRADRDALVRALSSRGLSFELSGTNPARPAPDAPLLFGTEYRHADEDAQVGERKPFEIDPHVVERGSRGHAATQNALAAFLRARGVEPRSPRADEPDYDLAWSDQRRAIVAEVKSITESNEERQLRLGLGEVLRYRHLLRSIHERVDAVLAIEREPSDPEWLALCAEVGVVLVWPSAFDRIDA